jgi:hypothetical protein
VGRGALLEAVELVVAAQFGRDDREEEGGDRGGREEEKETKMMEIGGDDGEMWMWM